MDWRMSRLGHRLSRKGPAVAITTVAIVAALTGTASGATGALLLGRDNTTDGTTSLHNSGSGPALELSTSSESTPVLDVDGNTTKNPGLNADLVDGLDSKDLQRRVTGDCGGTSAITAIEADGTATCGPEMLFARVGRDGSLKTRSTGVVESRRIVTGSYQIVFTVDSYSPSRCSLSVTPEVFNSPRYATLGIPRAIGNGVIHQSVQMWGPSGEMADGGFNLVAVCGQSK